MIHINENFLKLRAGYLFPEIGRRVRAFKEQNPKAKVISMGIGDVTQPLAPAVIEAMHRAVDEMGRAETFKGYDDGGVGYEFLRQVIVDNDYKTRGADIGIDEVFVSDGAKPDTGNMQEIFGTDNVVAVADPVYPVYVDTNVMAGRTGQANQIGQYEGMVYMPATAENGFVPEPPNRPVDMIYLCFPNNPTGSVATKDQLARWVAYARTNKALILFDAAYEAFISDPDIPHSIYEIEGARDVAIEFRSFSKTAGFTGVRCAYCIVPRTLKAWRKDGQPVEVAPVWKRRHCTKFNGVSYISQAGAAATYTPEGKKQIAQTIGVYMTNAKLIRERLTRMGYQVYGGINAPYIWLKTPDGLGSWEFFDRLLNKAHVVGTPGVGFGPAGEGYFRLTAFGRMEDVREALDRFALL
ncbi:MAG TPA: LL-diaminopimelate aminotransferase [Sedimentisphaerales bacterium]|nr:LL-diaminopimelate aminotransferase [Sedimentisphaerales bacterium]HRS10959.1 LL-diaminopimelate aminotransferase [Sedimentisphaerales bacterium]HRV48653.1 LL-diaminopimelate aminotransferase [Sedimentisphaerales bacterium]